MATVNATINPSQLQHTLQSFEQETTKMDMAGELSEFNVTEVNYNASMEYGKWKWFVVMLYCQRTETE